MTPVLAQSLTALGQAQSVRQAALRARRRVHAHRSTAAGMAALAAELESRPTWPKRLTVEEALGWPYRSMTVHRQRIRHHVGCSETRTVAALTDRELGVLIEALRSPELWRGEGRRAA